MSDRSGLGNKGEKNQSKFKGIDINNIYKGTSVTQQKSTTGVRNQQHGLQSLGKVASVRRMPPPANLPSLKSEAGGSDPQINLLPSNSAGWKEETNVEGGCGSPPKSSQPLLATGPSMEQNARRQTPTDGAQQQGYGGSNMGAPLWSSITSGAGRQEGFLDQNSPHFQEEFPQLAAGLDGKTQTSKKEEESKELQYGPGPNLRPQNVASWRDGGGSGAAQQQSPTSFQPPQPPLQPSPGPASSADGAAHEGGKPQAPMHLMMPGQIRPSVGGMHPPPPPPMAHMGQVPMMSHPYRTMMPPFAFHPGFQPHFPPNFMHPGMQRPPLMNSDFRFRGMPPHVVPPLMRPHEVGEEAGNGRPPVVKDCDLEQFDRLELSGGGWAQPTPDVDYTERLVFSDEEDSGTDAGSDRLKSLRPTGEVERDLRKSSDADKEDRQSSSRDREQDKRTEASRDLHDRQLQSGEARSSASPGMTLQKDIWMSQPTGPYIRSPQPMDQRPWPPGAMPLGNPGAAAMGYHPMAPFGPRPAFHPPSPRMGGVQQRGGMDGDDEEVWRRRRKQQSEDMAVAIERARQRRLEEERRMKEEQVAGSAEKLRQLDEKLGRKEDKEKTVGENSEGREGVSSGQENGDRTCHGDGRNSAALTASGGRTATRLPPRLQKCPSVHSTDEQGSQADKEADVPALDLELTSSSSSLDQVHQSSPMGHVRIQRQPGSPHGCPQPPPHPLHDMPRMGYWPPESRWGPFMMDPRMGPRMPFDPVTGLPMHMSMSWAVKEKDEGGSETNQRSPECYYNRHVWPMQGAEEVPMRGPGMNPEYYGYPMEMDQRSYVDRLDKRDRSQIISGGHGGFREESEPRDGDDVSTNIEPLSRGQRDYRSSVSEANCSKDCDEKIKNHGSFTSRNSDRGSSLSGRRDPPSTKRNTPKLESTDKSAVHAKEPMNKQDSGLIDTESSSRVESDNVRKGGTDDGRRSKQEKQMRNSERRKIEKQFEHSYRNKNDSCQHLDKEQSSSDLRPNEHRSSCPPPISAQQAQQNSPVNSGFMSLKRTRQTASSNSLNSSDRRIDSLGTVVRSNVMVASQKSMSRESLKLGTEVDIKEQVKETAAGNRSEKGTTGKVDQIVPNSTSSRDDNKDTTQNSTLVPALIEKSELPEKGTNKPSSRKPKDGSKRSNSRRKQDHRDPERTGRTGQGSREFVRGGRGKAYGYGRWRGGGSRDIRVGYNENYEEQYDAEQEKMYESGYVDIDLKGQSLEGASGTVVAGGNRSQADGRWQSNQNRSAVKSGSSKNRERPRGQRGAWHASEGPLQDSSLGNVNRQKQSKQTCGKEAGTVTTSASVLGDADLGKDEARQEQNSTGTSVKHLDSVPRKESSRKDEGEQRSNRNQYRKGRGGASNGGEGGGRAGGGRGFPDQPSSGRDRQGPMEEGQQPRRNQEDSRMGNNSSQPLENIRYDRNGPIPPRFANNDGRRGGSYGCGDRRRRGGGGGGGGQGPGRTNHQGNRSSKDQSNKKTPASEFNEEWETASEGSDNLSRGFHAKKDLNCDAPPTGEKPESSRKGFSNQRRGTRRRGNRGEPPTSRTSGGPRGNSARSVGGDGSLQQKGPDAASGSKEGQDGVDKSNSDKPHGSNGTVHPIYRLDQVVYDDPRLIQGAFSSANRYNWKFMGKTMSEYEKFNDFYQDTMSDITSLWRPDEKDYKGNRFGRNNVIFSGFQFRRNKSRGIKQRPLPPRFAHLLSVKKQQQLDEDRSQCDSEDWFPQGLCHPPMTASSHPLAVDVHICGGERHDSGVDMSEPPNSLVSSCRSSPCNGDDIFHCTLDQSSFLDFAFDDDFKCAAESTPAEDSVASFDRGSTTEADLKHYMSKATDSLGMKITSVRAVWNPEISQNLGEDEQFASDKLRLAMLSEHMHGQSTGDWKFEQKDADAKQPQRCDGSSNSGEKRSCCSSQNLETLNSRKALLPRVMSDDSLSLKEYCSNCLFMSSLNSEVWKKNPTEFADESGRTGFVLPPKFGPLISLVLRPETTNVDAFTRGPEMSVHSGVIGSHRGHQRNIADHNRNVSSPHAQHLDAGAMSTLPVGMSFVANSNESSQAGDVASNNPPAMGYFSRVGEEDGQDINHTQELDEATTVLGKKNSEADRRDKSQTN